MDIGATVLKVGFTKVWTFSKLYLFCIPLLHILYLVFRQWVPSPPQTGARAFKTKLASQLQSANNPLWLQRRCCINRRYFIVEQFSPFHKADPKPTKANLKKKQVEAYVSKLTPEQVKLQQSMVQVKIGLLCAEHKIIFLVFLKTLAFYCCFLAIFTQLWKLCHYH